MILSPARQLYYQISSSRLVSNYINKLWIFGKYYQARI